jgi:hypothetical protein
MKKGFSYEMDIRKLELGGQGCPLNENSRTLTTKRGALPPIPYTAWVLRSIKSADYAAPRSPACAAYACFSWP